MIAGEETGPQRAKETPPEQEDGVQGRVGTPEQEQCIGRSPLELVSG